MDLPADICERVFHPRRDSLKLFAFDQTIFFKGCLYFHRVSPLRSIILGTQFFGYLALGIWMRQYSALWANTMVVGAAMIYTFGLAHHILGCAAEWIYIKSGHTEEGRKLTNDFFCRTSATMVGCYAGILIFSVAHFVPVVSGMTPLPAWACVFNLLPLFLVQAPFNIPGAGNIAGAVMYLGLFILFMI